MDDAAQDGGRLVLPAAARGEHLLHLIRVRAGAGARVRARVRVRSGERVLHLQHCVRQCVGRVVAAAREADGGDERGSEDGRGAQARAGGQARPRLDLHPAAALRELLGQ